MLASEAEKLLQFGCKVSGTLPLTTQQEFRGHTGGVGAFASERSRNVPPALCSVLIPPAAGPRRGVATLEKFVTFEDGNVNSKTNKKGRKEGRVFLTSQSKSAFYHHGVVDILGWIILYLGCLGASLVSAC